MSNAMLRLYVTAMSFVQDRYNHRKDNGATAVEYGLLAGLMAIVVVAAVVILRDKITGLFNNISTTLPS